MTQACKQHHFSTHIRLLATFGDDVVHDPPQPAREQPRALCESLPRRAPSLDTSQ